MIDTVRVRFRTPPSNRQLRDWLHVSTTNPSQGKSEKYVLNKVITQDKISVRCTYRPYDYQSLPNLILEFSLPKLVLRNNIMMISDLKEGIQEANSFISSIHSLPTIDISRGRLLRLDLCYNHTVGDDLSSYVKAISKLEYPHRRTQYHLHEGVVFYSKQTRTSFYNKFNECGDPRAEGILRQETSIRNRRRIDEMMGMNDPTLVDINPPWVASTLQRDLRRLHLHEAVIADRDSALGKLIKTHGYRRGYYYFGILTRLSEVGKKELALEAGKDLPWVSRQKKAINKAGVAPTTTDQQYCLPGLEIDSTFSNTIVNSFADIDQRPQSITKGFNAKSADIPISITAP